MDMRGNQFLAKAEGPSALVEQFHVARIAPTTNFGHILSESPNYIAK